MPNSETVETKSRQPMGSSKRKRKQSIKRNIVVEENSDADTDSKSTRVEKMYFKKVKIKALKDSDEPNDEFHNPVDDPICEAHSEEKATENTSKALGTNEHLKCKASEGDCSSVKQCQNCKFCSEHTLSNQDTEESTDKQLKTKKKFTCEICAKEGSPRVYNSAQKHKNHLATVHEIYSEEVKRFECTDCPETVWFPTKSKFTYHLGTKHPGVIKFVCEICTESFKLKANYKSHMKSHNIVVPKKFTCNVCNGSFVNKAGYEAHKKRFPGPHIKQSCSHCGFSFSKEKHMKNHRCKTLLLEEAAKAKNAHQTNDPTTVQESGDPLKINVEQKANTQNTQTQKMGTQTEDVLQKKATSEGDLQANKRVYFHRIIPQRSQDQAVYRPVQMQTQNVSEQVVVQELREIDIEGGTFIATSATEPEQQFIVRDINGHLVQGNQILQLDVNDMQPGEESQVYLADWNILTPYVIREKSP